MTNIANNIEHTASLFVSNMGNPKVAAKHFGTLIERVVSNRDTEIVTRNVLSKLHKRGDGAGVRAVVQVCEAVYPTTKVKFSKKDGFNWKIKGVEADAEAVTRLEKALANGLTLRSTLAQKVKGEQAKPEFNVTKWAENQAKAHPGKLDAMIAALQAQRNAK